VLEIGGGSGHQARTIASKVDRVVSIDIASSRYRGERVFDVQEYDGIHIPFPDREFDCVYSSNVLEHILQLDAFEAELHRVLSPNGRCLHIVPTHTWRFWTSLTHYPSLPGRVLNRIAKRGRLTRDERVPEAHEVVPNTAPEAIATPVSRVLRSLRALTYAPRHGERGNILTEAIYFHPTYWRRHFLRTGWTVETDFDVGYLYTGHELLGNRLSLRARAALARALGSSCHAFILSH
jgi:SAM-dependent methyltransferase